MNKSLITILATGLLALSTSTAAFTGNEVLPGCSILVEMANTGKADESDMDPYAAYCLGVVGGIWGYGTVDYGLTGDSLFCAPDGATKGQAVKLIVNFIKDHPEISHRDFPILAVAAIAKQWGCSYE